MKPEDKAKVQQALDDVSVLTPNEWKAVHIPALRQLLEAEPVQEPVAWICYGAPGKRDIDFEEADINGLPIGTLLYTTTPAQEFVCSTGLCHYKAQRQWVGLTDEEIDELYETHHNEYGYPLTLSGYERAIEQRLKEKNT